MITKRKKNSRMHGKKTHGYGSMKKHRGFGHKGGKGNAGSGKRADSKKPSVWKERTGRYGFTSHQKKDKAINIFQLNRLALQEEKGKVVADLTKMGYDKLLATGTPEKAFHITVAAATERAKKKIEDAKGSFA